MKASGWVRSCVTSTTSTRWWTLTWVAARPMPGAAYMVSSMSSISRRTRVVHAVDGRGAGAQARVWDIREW